MPPLARQTRPVGARGRSVDEVVQRLAAAGFPLDHWGGKTARRNSAYLMEGDDIQFEFVEYATASLAERAEYAQQRHTDGSNCQVRRISITPSSRASTGSGAAAGSGLGEGSPIGVGPGLPVGAGG